MAGRFLSILSVLLLVFSAGAAAEPSEAPLPAELSPAIDHLLSQVGPARGGEFNPARVEPLLQFVLGARGGSLQYEGAGRRKLTSAFHAFEVRSDLSHLLQYAYNPAIPPQVITPSSVRLGRWTEVDGRPQPLPRLWERLPLRGPPVIVRGSEHEEITPNLATGTYFSYDLHRTLILFSWGGRPVLINISRQKDRSEVGMKGAVVGDDAQWNYLYSGDKGLAYGGFGWVDSYMYEAYSIGIFLETGEPRPALRCGMLKWLDAGWKGMNLVRRQHIHEGLARYARDLKAVLENPRLPAPGELAAGFSRLAQLPTPELEAHLRRSLEQMDRHHGRDPAIARAGLAESLRDGSYPQRLNRLQLEAAVALELMKAYLARPGGDPRLVKAAHP